MSFQSDINVAERATVALAAQDDLDALQANLEGVLSAECDRLAVHRFFDRETSLDASIWSLATELGWLAAPLPEAYGGLGLGQQGLDVVHRELGRWLAPGPFLATLTAAQWLLACAAAAERDAYLPRIAAGELKVAIPCDLRDAQALAIVDGRVSGRSGLLLGSADSGLAIVPAAGPDGARGWAIVEIAPAAAQLRSRLAWDRTRELCELSCDGLLPTAIVNDPDGEVLQVLNAQLALGVASDSVGGAAAISDQTIEYLKTRVQFGRPIGSFQALKHRAADLIILREIQEHMVAQAVEAAQRRWPDAAMWASLAKAGASGAYRFIADDCVLLHGGIGYTWEYDCHMYLKRARLNEALGMANAAQYDAAALALAEATAAGRSVAELAQ